MTMFLETSNLQLPLTALWMNLNGGKQGERGGRGYPAKQWIPDAESRLRHKDIVDSVCQASSGVKQTRESDGDIP